MHQISIIRLIETEKPGTTWFLTGIYRWYWWIDWYSLRGGWNVLYNSARFMIMTKGLISPKNIAYVHGYSWNVQMEDHPGLIHFFLDKKCLEMNFRIMQIFNWSYSIKVGSRSWSKLDRPRLLDLKTTT